MSIEKIKDLLYAHGDFKTFDALGVGVIDFNSGESSLLECYQTEDGQFWQESPSCLFYDLASLTKPLVNSLSFLLFPEKFDEKMNLCLNHQGGLPSWGLLSQDTWRDQILSYPIQKKETLYSDFSALRVMLELEKKDVNVHGELKKIWSNDLVFWKDLPEDAFLLQYGYRGGLPNMGVVHDPNAFVIDDFCSHAGLFSTLSGLCETLLKIEASTQMIKKVSDSMTKDRFVMGFDRVLDPTKTLAGAGCGAKTFGHLGFTGTSFWIDPDQKKGIVILSNATRDYWYKKDELNELRQKIGALLWLEKSSSSSLSR